MHRPVKEDEEESSSPASDTKGKGKAEPSELLGPTTEEQDAKVNTISAESPKRDNEEKQKV